jgi:integrase/recombinase XerD
MIHSFFGYVMAEDLRTADLCRRILRIPPKRQKRPALEYLSGDEIKQILESVDRASPNGRRDYLLLALLYDTGARVQEVLDLRPCDFRFDSPVHVRLTGKGRKERLCPLLPQTVRLVESFLKEHDRLITDSQPLFQNKRTRKLSRHGVRYILKKYLNSAAKEMPTLLRRSLSPHTFRHSKSIHLLQSGIPLVTIKDFLGHADLRTTHIYAKTDLEAKRQALQMGGSPVMVKNTPEIPADILHWLETI